MLRNLIAFSLLGLALIGCVAPPISLSPQLQKSLGAVQPVIYVPQNNLDVDITPGNPGATGILGALIVAAIDENRRGAAQRASAGLTEATRDFDFRTRMGSQLNAEFARVKSMHLVTPVGVETTDSESQRRIAYDRSTSSAVLMTNVTYKMVSSKLVVSAANIMYPKAANLMAFRSKPNDTDPLDVGNAIYRKTFTYTQGGLNAGNIKASLNKSIANVAWQIAADINHMTDTAATSTASDLSAPLPQADAAGHMSPTGAGLNDVERVPLNDVERVPFLTDKGRAAYRAWLTRPFPRAFALGQDGYFWAAWGPVPADSSMPVDISDRALEGCRRRASGKSCRLYAVNDRVVWEP